MASGPFDRTVIYPGEKPLADDINQLASQLDHGLRFFARALFSDPNDGALSEGFINQGLSVVANSPAGLSVRVKAGLGFQSNPALVASAINGIIGLDDRAEYQPIALLSDHAFTVPTPPSAPNTRIDIIEARASRLLTEPQTRMVFDAGTGAFKPGTLAKILTWILDGRTETIVSPANGSQPLVYKQGVAGNPGVAPATTQGYIKLAEISVGSDVTTIGQSDISDNRPKLRATHYPRRPVKLSDFLLVAGTGQVDAFDISTSTVASLQTSLPASVGERLRSITMYVRNKSAGGNLDLTLERVDREDNAISKEQVAQLTVTGEGEAVLSLDHFVAENFRYIVTIITPNETIDISQVELEVE